MQSDIFATLLSGALCNTAWRHVATGTVWHCSWRHAGSIVAMLRCEGDYMDWYCSMGEGFVDEQVLAEINALGWELAETQARAVGAAAVSDTQEPSDTVRASSRVSAGLSYKLLNQIVISPERGSPMKAPHDVLGFLTAVKYVGGSPRTICQVSEAVPAHCLESAQIVARKVAIPRRSDEHETGPDLHLVSRRQIYHRGLLIALW